MKDEARAASLGGGEATYEIGPFRLDPAAGVLTRMGVAEPLGPRAVAVLTMLVQRAREPVTKDALMQSAWPGLVVEDANLSVQISSIRRVLAQAPGGERWLETLARRGYRFIGPVVELRNGEPQAAQREPIGLLPESLTSFVGRERELVDLKRLLAKSRLLTVVGPGGIGKTRLAMQAAAEVRDAYRDGVWFVDFAPLDDPALVSNAMAQVLGARQMADKPLIDALHRRIEGLRLLLIFDNCEHVVDAAAHLSETLLRRSAQATILVTSREPLRIGGEQVYRLSTLSVPDTDADAEAIRQSDSVLLFVERAQRQQHDFVVTSALARSVAHVCARLDGIPFALELAAALVPTYSIDEINARLDDRFDLLTGGSRTALPRQQTLRATLDWSFDLLSDDERKVLRRASVFSGGFTSNDAAAVVTDDTLPSLRVEILIAQLVARSLLIVDAGDVAARYRFLDTTRAYAREKLDGAVETTVMRRRHAEHFRSVFDSAGAAWLRLADAEWRARYLPEVDNVRSALDWSLGKDGDPTLAIALAGGTGPVWTGLSLYGEGIAHLEAAASRLPSNASRSEQARLRLWLGLLQEASSPTRAVAEYRSAMGLYRAIDDVEGIAQSAIWLARALTLVGQYEESAAVLASALPAIDRSDLPRLRAFYFANAGTLKTMTHDLAAAQSLHQQALALYREIGSAVGIAGSLNNLANASWALGDLEAAESAFREAVAMHRTSGHRGKDPLGFALGNLTGVLTERGSVAEALDAAREGFPLLGSSGNAWAVIDHLALRAALVGDFVNAVTIAGYADAAHAAKDAARGPNEARARRRLEELTNNRFDRAVMEQLLAQGSRLTETEAYRLALSN